MPGTTARPQIAPQIAGQIAGQHAAWVRACVAAETVGMTAASAAAVAAGHLGPLPGLGLVVAGGLVEGTALGWAQSRVLARQAPRLSRTRYLVATVLVAGLGWAAASSPAALSDPDEGGPQPALVVIVVAAAGLGLVMGAALGAAQALALRGAVAHPWRWVVANAAAWPPAIAVIFLGATSPDADWSGGAVVATGIVTGIAAGAVLGAVSGWFLPSLTRTAPARPDEAAVV